MVSVTFPADFPGIAVTPGQTCAAYLGQRCLGGGEIVEREWTWAEGVVPETEVDEGPRVSKRAIRRAERAERKEREAAENLM